MSILGKIENIVPDDFFVWMKPFYMLHGFLPPKKRMMRYIYITIRTTYFILFVIELVSQWWSISIEFRKTGLEHISLQINLVMFITIFQFRIFMWLLNIDEMLKIVEIISRKSFNFECFSITSVGSWNLYKNKKNDDIENVLDYYKHLSTLWSTNGTVHLGRNRYDTTIIN